MIEVKNLIVKYKDKSLFYQDLSFEQGKSYFIYGDSGAGKSTLLKYISLVLRNHDGITYDGVHVGHLDDKRKSLFKKENIGVYLSDQGLCEDLTVSDHLYVAGVSKEKLSLYHLEKMVNKKVKELSSGEKQRLGVLIALYKKGIYKFFDEPIAHVNRVLADKLMDSILEVHNINKGITIVVSHDLSYKHLFDYSIDISDICNVKEGGII